MTTPRYMVGRETFERNTPKRVAFRGRDAHREAREFDPGRELFFGPHEHAHAVLSLEAAA